MRSERRMRWGSIRTIFFVTIFILLVLGCEKKEEDVPIDTAEDAKSKSGSQAQGGILLPNGRRITPAGEREIELGSFPMNIVLTSDGNTAIITNNGWGLFGKWPRELPEEFDIDVYKEGEKIFEENLITKEQSLSIVDLETGEVKDIPAHFDPDPEKNQAFFLGLAVSNNGRRLYASGGQTNKVMVFEKDDGGSFNKVGEIPVSGFPGWITLSHDGNFLYVAENLGNKVSRIDLSTGKTTKVSVGQYPYSMALSLEGDRLYVSNWGPPELRKPCTVSVIDLDEFRVIKDIEVGKNPEGLALTRDGKRLYVANSDTDGISVIDTSTLKVIKTISLKPGKDAPMGSSPTALALSPDEKVLYAASSQKNAVDVVSLESASLVGSIPTAWYPTALALDSKGETLYVVNAKGVGSGPNPDFAYIGGIIKGTLSIIPVPDNAELREYTSTVRLNNQRPKKFYEEKKGLESSPIPGGLGESSPIKHVVFILRENKTYDQVLGDMEGTRADPKLCIFGEYYTPNLHKLAREFTNLDNFYSDAEVSVQGHLWNTGFNINDFSEKTWMASYRDGSRFQASGAEPATYPDADFFFHNLLKHEVDFNVYGQIVGIAGELGLFFDHLSPEYGLYWTMDKKDVDKAAVFIKDLEGGKFASFTYIVLPNDHTYGITPGKPTPESMVADNDEGTGMIVEAISKSRFWKETAIFITEDDPQSGADHIDAHRTICLVISPYSRRGYTSSTHYSFPSIHKTIELILNLPPMSRFDELAAPMYDCFRSKPDYTPYEAVPRNFDETFNPAPERYKDPEMAKMARRCRKMNWAIPDQVDIGDILERVMKRKRDL